MIKACCLNSIKFKFNWISDLNFILSRHFIHHADAGINVLQTVLALCEMRLITAIALSTFMSILFMELVKRNISKSEKSKKSAWYCTYRQFYIYRLVSESKTGKCITVNIIDLPIKWTYHSMPFFMFFTNIIIASIANSNLSTFWPNRTYPNYK